MATYTIQSITEAGTNGTYTAVSASDTFTVNVATDLDKIHILHIKNGGASPDSVVVDDVNTQTPTGATAFNPDITVSVTNAQDRFIRINPRRFANQTTGVVGVTNSFITSVTAAVFLAT